MIDTGGSAFPSENSRQTGNMTWHHEGMSLRDYFAAKAMSAFLVGVNEDGYSADGISIMAYEIADAMLKEREKCK